MNENAWRGYAANLLTSLRRFNAVACLRQLTARGYPKERLLGIVYAPFCKLLKQARGFISTP